MPGNFKNRSLMPRSISSKFFPCFLFVLTGVNIPPASSAAEEFITDAGIKASFEAKLSALFQAGGVPTATDTLKQLREEKRSNVTLPPVAAVPPADDAASYGRARDASLVLGHLYLCGKCDKHHANLAGGVIISPDGLVLTNYHVLDFKEALVFGAMTAGGDVHVIDEVLAASKKDDIALVRLRNAKALPFVALQETVSTGDEVFVVSHPDGFFYTFTKGYLSRKYLTPKQQIPRLQITADFARGSSGSGIFNARGELVGIATSTNSIYYEQTEEKVDNLQMVIHSGVPVSSIKKLFAPATP